MADIVIHKLDIYSLLFQYDSKFCCIRTELLNVILILPSFKYFTSDTTIMSKASIFQ